MAEGIIEFPIDDMDHWENFVADNRDYLMEVYGSIANAEATACQGGLMIGGGAAPLYHVYFVG